MSLRIDTLGAQLYEGDCLDVMATMPANGFSTVITDPPYGIGFMGKAWDGEAIKERATSGMRKTTEREDGWGTHYSPAMAAGRYDFSASGNAAFQEWCRQWAEASLRITKPGGFLLAFGGTRTWHRLACAIEDAGWEIRDTLMWLYGSGFPKSLDISKAIDKAAGAEREVVGQHPDASRRSYGGEQEGWHRPWKDDPDALLRRRSITAPSTDAAREWDGWGTALKPAWEPILVAMKPLDGTFAENAQRHRVAGLNIDGGRIGVDLSGQRPTLEAWDDERNLCGSCAANASPSARRTARASGASTAPKPAAPTSSERGATRPIATSKTDTECSAGPSREGRSENRIGDTSLSIDGSGRNTTGRSQKATSSTTSTATSSTTESRTCARCGATGTTAYTRPSGRWPSNVALDEAAAAQLDAQTGELTRGKEPEGGFVRHAPETREGIYGAGKGLWKDEQAADSLYGDTGGASRFMYVAKASGEDRGNRKYAALPLFGEPESEDRNTHPTVKPLALMRWLVRLTATPTAGAILDCFAGSGTTLVAARMEGRPVVGIEREADYCAIVERRLASQAIERE